MENLELVVLTLALLFSTTNIFVYSWFDKHEKYLHIGIWIIKVTGAFPGLVFSIWAIYTIATDKESTLGMVLVTAGLLLAAGTVQLLSLLLRKQGYRLTKQIDSDRNQKGPTRLKFIFDTVFSNGSSYGSVHKI